MLAPVMRWSLLKPISMYLPNRLLLSLRVVLALPIAWRRREEREEGKEGRGKEEGRKGRRREEGEREERQEGEKRERGREGERE